MSWRLLTFSLAPFITLAVARGEDGQCEDGAPYCASAADAAAIAAVTADAAVPTASILATHAQRLHAQQLLHDAGLQHWRQLEQRACAPTLASSPCDDSTGEESCPATAEQQQQQQGDEVSRACALQRQMLPLVVKQSELLELQRQALEEMMRDAEQQTAAAAPAAGAARPPLSDALGEMLAKASDESLPMLARGGELPENVTLAGVDDGDVDAIVELLHAGGAGVRGLLLPEHGLSTLGAARLAEALRDDVAPQLERVQLCEKAGLPLAPLRHGADTRELRLVNRGLCGLDVVVLATFLAGGGVAATLEVLDLSANSLGGGAGFALAEALRSRDAAPLLHTLILDRSGIGDASALSLLSALRAGATPKLRMLSLAGCALGPDGVAALAQLFGDGDAGRLEEINLSANDVGDVGAGALAAGLQRASALGAPGGALGALRSLGLDSAGIGERGATLLLRVLPGLAAGGAAGGAAAPRLTTLKMLRNGFGATLARRLVDATEGWPNRSLAGDVIWRKAPHALNLAHRKLHDADAVMVAASLRDERELRAVRHLWLHNNGFGDEGALALLEVVRREMGGLTHFSLNDNSLGDDGGVAAVGVIAAGLLPLVEEFWLSSNNLGARTAAAVVDALDAGAGPKLRNMWLRDNRGFNAEWRAKLTASCKARKIFCQL